MDNIDVVWNKIKDSPGIEKSITIFNDETHLLLLGNWSTFATPLAALSLKLLSSQSSDDTKHDKFVGFDLSYELRIYDEFDKKEHSFAILKCNDEKFNSYFLKFSEKLIEELIENKSPDMALKNFISKWTEFFKKKKKELLKIEQIIGLYGELKFLKFLIEKKGATLDVVNFWRGPHEESWDFVMSHNSQNYQVEVKTSHYDKVKINSLKQLNSDIPIESYLLLQKVNYQKTAIPSETHTVINLIDEIRNNLIDSKASVEFIAKLELICDFNDEAQIENCRKVVFQSKAEQWYLLDQNFPILSDKTIQDHVFRKIGEVKYTLSLDSLPFLTSSKFLD